METRLGSEAIVGALLGDCRRLARAVLGVCRRHVFKSEHITRKQYIVRTSSRFERPLPTQRQATHHKPAPFSTPMPTTRKRTRNATRQPPLFVGYVREMHGLDSGKYQRLYHRLVADLGQPDLRVAPDAAAEPVRFALHAMELCAFAVAKMKTIGETIFWLQDHSDEAARWNEGFYEDSDDEEDAQADTDSSAKDDQPKKPVLYMPNTPPLLHALNICWRTFGIEAAQWTVDHVIAVAAAAKEELEKGGFELKAETVEDKLFREVSTGAMLMACASLDTPVDSDNNDKPLSIAKAMEAIDRKLMTTVVIPNLPRRYYSMVGMDGAQPVKQTPNVSDFFNSLSAVLDIRTGPREATGSDDESEGDVDADDDADDEVGGDDDIASIASSAVDTVPVTYQSCSLPSPEVFSEGCGSGFRKATEEELDAIAYQGSEIVLASSSLYCSPPGRFRVSEAGFTVRQLWQAVEQYEKRARPLSQWFNAIDMHHVFFEGLDKDDDEEFVVRWGS